MCPCLQCLPAALRGSSPLCALLGQALQPFFLREASRGHAAVGSSLSCEWVWLDLQAVRGASLYLLCLPSRHGIVLPNRVSLSPASSLPRELSLCGRTAFPLVFVFSSFFPPCHQHCHSWLGFKFGHPAALLPCQQHAHAQPVLSKVSQYFPEILYLREFK